MSLRVYESCPRDVLRLLRNESGSCEITAWFREIMDLILPIMLGFLNKRRCLVMLLSARDDFGNEKNLFAASCYGDPSNSVATAAAITTDCNCRCDALWCKGHLH